MVLMYRAAVRELERRLQQHGVGALRTRLGNDQGGANANGRDIIAAEAGDADAAVQGETNIQNSTAKSNILSRIIKKAFEKGFSK